jgi:hypothetical protein
VLVQELRALQARQALESLSPETEGKIQAGASIRAFQWSGERPHLLLRHHRRHAVRGRGVDKCQHRKPLVLSRPRDLLEQFI